VSHPDTLQLLDQLRASAADLDPSRAATYAAAGPELWVRATDVAIEVLVLAVAHRVGIIDEARFHSEVTQVPRHTDESTLVAAVAWQVQALALLPEPPVSPVYAEEGAR
jgi:hypothetical protein